MVIRPASSRIHGIVQSVASLAQQATGTAPATEKFAATQYDRFGSETRTVKGTNNSAHRERLPNTEQTRNEKMYFRVV